MKPMMNDAGEGGQEELPLTPQEQPGEVLPPSEEDDPWGELDGEFDSDDFGEEVVEETPQKGDLEPVTPVEETPKEGETPPKEETPPPTPAVPEQQPVQSEPSAQSQPQTQEELLARRKMLEEELAKTYAISPEDADTLRLSPEEVLPKLAARVTVDTYERVLETLVSQLPSFVKNILESSTQQRSLEEEFYAANPGLAAYAQSHGREQVDQVAAQIAVILRAQNPSMPKEELIQKVGRSAEAMLGLQSMAPQEGTPPPKGVKETVVEEVVNRPFVPARGVSTVQQQRKAGPNNPFESLNEMWDNDEFGDE